MRIAIIALSCPPGGMLHYASQLANALAERAEVALFTPAQPGLAGYLAERVRWVETPPFSEPGQRLRNIARQADPRRYRALAEAIRAFAPDAVHFVKDHPANALLAPLLRCPAFLTVHDPTQHPGETSALKAWLTRRMVRQASGCIVHAESLRPELLAQGVPEARTHVIPHGDYGFLKRHARAGVSERPMVLCFGRLVKYKGLEVLCRAERLLAKRLGDYELVIAGEGDTSLFASEIGPSGRVKVLNRFLSDPEVAELFQQARLVVLPYTQASQSGVLAIAFAFGVPVVVTATGGLPEAVGFGEAGLIVPPGDPEALAEGIATLWRDEAQRDRLRRNGAARLEAMSWPRIAAQHLALYRRATASERFHLHPAQAAEEF